MKFFCKNERKTRAVEYLFTDASNIYARLTMCAVEVLFAENWYDSLCEQGRFPANNYLLKVNNRNSRKRCEIVQN